MSKIPIVVLLALALLISTGSAIGRDTPTHASAGDEPMVVRLYVRDQEHLNVVAGQLDIWEVHRDALYVVARVTPAEFAWLQEMGYRLEIDAEKSALLDARAVLDPRFHYFDDYYTNLNGLYIVDWLQETAAAYPALTELLDIGDAWLAGREGEHDRDIWVLRITNEDPALGAVEDKPIFYLFAGIHAREVAIPELAIRYIKYLTGGFEGEGGYGADPDVTWLVDHQTLYVLVSQNPDGHWVNEQDTDAYWRKNMDDDDGCSDPDNWGVDMNRNSSFFWGCCGGSSGNPCAETYRGPSAGSEPETQAFQNHFASVMPDQNGDNGDNEIADKSPPTTTGIFISLHAYQDEILWPFGFDADGAPNYDELATIGRKMAYYNGFDPTGFLYTVDGATDDWTYGKFGVASFTFEVGPQTGSCGGFFPDYECIDGAPGYTRDFWAENKPAFLFAHKIARTPYLTAYGPDAAEVLVMPAEVSQGTPVTLTATVADHRHADDPLEPRPIAGAEYFVDAPGADGTGIPLSPADGSWGDLTEMIEATVDTGPLAPGKHYLLVHGQNDDGAWGPFTAVFLTTTVSVPPPTAGFLTNSPVCAGASVVFTNTTSPAGVPTDYLWDLGDGVTSTLESPTHVYPAGGTYPVVLTATNVAGEDTYTDTVEILTPPQAAFAFAPADPEAGEPITFTDLSTGDPTAWEWSFGEGGEETAQHPVYTYEESGTYTVTLRAQNGCGWSEVAERPVEVAPAWRTMLYLPLLMR